MRVFLIQTARGLFSSSGGYKANICLLRYLVSRGHSVRQLCYFHHNEVEDYVQKMATESGHEVRVHKKILHLSSGSERSGADVEVVQLTMKDGVEIVALHKEAFDAAFGGKDNLHKEISRETAEYIEVTSHTTPRSVHFGLYWSFLLILFWRRREFYPHASLTSYLSYKTK